MVGIGEEGYKISEIACIAGVSKRTVDYYTKLGLLCPVRSCNNYRYYTSGDLVRLKIIDAMKKKRYTLQEIKMQLAWVESVAEQHSYYTNNGNKVDVEYLKQQVKQFEYQLEQLHPAASGNGEVTPQLKNKIMLQGMGMMHSLALYLSEIASL